MQAKMNTTVNVENQLLIGSRVRMRNVVLNVGFQK